MGARTRANGADYTAGRKICAGRHYPTPMADQPDSPPTPAPHPSFPAALRLWLGIGLLSFGGPAAQIAMLHDEVVEKRKWVAEGRFQHALRFCSFLPGPEAQQLATCCGWYLHGIPGGLAAGFLFFLPAAILLWLLSWVYAAYGQVALVNAAFHGLKAAVLALLAAAVVRLAKKSLKGWGARGIAILTFIVLDGSLAPFPVVIALAGLAGWGLTRSRYGRLLLPLHGDHDAPLPQRAAGRGATALFIAAGLILWWAPVAVCAALLGKDHILTEQGLFFSKAACVTFGGAYAVLPYVAHHAVQAQWITEVQTIDGLALAETTPGPLIIVLEFFGFQGAWKHPGAWHPWVAGTLGAAMTAWTTFVPSTFFALAGAPHLERVRKIKWLAGAMAGISAAVIGIIASLGVWMLFNSLLPGNGRVDWFILLVAPAAFALLHLRKWGMVPVLLACAATGMAWKLAAG